MKLPVLFVILAVLQLPGYALLLWLTGPQHPLWFYGAEVIAVLNIIYICYFYHRIVKPVRTIGGGMDLLKGGDWNVRLRHVGQPEVDGVVDVFNNMLCKLHGQQTIIEEKTNFLVLLAEASPVGLVVVDGSGTVRMCNSCAIRQLGADVSGSKLDGTCNELGRVMSEMEDGSDLMVRKNALDIKRVSRRHFMESGIRKSFFIIADLSDVVSQAEREGYEKIVRTISHEVHNTIGVIATALGSFELSTDDAILAESCRSRALAMSEFVGAYARVVKTGAPLTAPVNLPSLVRRLQQFLESLCKSAGCKMHVECTETEAVVSADAAQLEQVLVNTVKNACEACSGSGTVQIRAGADFIEVCDNGKGLSPQVQALVFTPFFSTKPNGQGIGLTLVREILERHDAEFSLTSNNGITTFRAKFRH